MSINAILAASSPQTQPAAQIAGKGSSQSYADWYASLTGATGSASSTGSTAATAGASSSQLSDNMQALLTQLQSGNTIAPSGSGSAAGAAGAAGVGHAHHHHHHGAGGSSGADSTGGASDQDSSGVLEDIAGSLTGNPSSGSSGSSSDSMFGTSAANASRSTGSGFMSGLQSLGTTALAGVRQALQAYAAMHGVQIAQASTTA